MQGEILSNRPWRFRRLMMLALLAIGAFALVASACGDDDDDDDDDDTTTTTTATATEEEDGGDDAALEISAEDETAFSTDSLTVAANTPFTITFDNQDDLVHNVAVFSPDGEELQSTELEAGPITQELTFDEGLEAGEYEYNCQAHPADMKGTLTVE